MPVFRKRQKDAQPVSAMEVMTSVLAGLGVAPGQGARPMGHHRDLLLIGAEDAMLAQELHLMADEILERVNAFMEQPFFSAIKVSLLMGKAGLDKTAARTTAPARPPRSIPEPPNAHGLYLEAMDPTSPVARAYARFVRQRQLK